MRELAVQSANGTMSSDDMAATDAELGQLIAEVERVGANYCLGWQESLVGGNGTTDGGKSFVFQVGVNGTASDRVTIEIDDTRVGFGP